MRPYFFTICTHTMGKNSLFVFLLFVDSFLICSLGASSKHCILPIRVKLLANVTYHSADGVDRVSSTLMNASNESQLLLFFLLDKIQEWFCNHRSYPNSRIICLLLRKFVTFNHFNWKLCDYQTHNESANCLSGIKTQCM